MSATPSATTTGDHLHEVGAHPELPGGWSVAYRPVVASTQDLAREAARAGAAGRLVYVADQQTAGRGRQGRQWMAPSGTALMLSALFRERATDAPTPQRYTWLASVALAEAVEALVPPLRGRARIKWPNDLMLGDFKAAGVLSEGAWDGEWLAVVVGIGVNVQLASTQLANLRALAPRATSLSEAAGQPVDRAALLVKLLWRLDAWLARPHADLEAAWRERLWGRGQRLALRDGALERAVVVLGADAGGALRVRLPDGSETTTTTGELIL